MSTNKVKDLNYYWSCFVLSFAVIGLIASGYMLYKASRPTAEQAAKNLQAQIVASQQAAKLAAVQPALPPAVEA